jgi:hypothetical protein
LDSLEVKDEQLSSMAEVHVAMGSWKAHWCRKLDPVKDEQTDTLFLLPFQNSTWSMTNFVQQQGRE